MDDAVDIDMTAKDGNVYKNNIQQYIDSYKGVLEIMVSTGITVRACTKPELDSELPNTLTDFQKSSIRNPSKTGVFWLGSAYTGKDIIVWYVQPNGYLSNHDGYGNNFGVRPIIEIPIE